MPQPRIHPSLANARGELAALAGIVAGGNVSDQHLDAIGSRGAQLIIDICTTRSLSLGDLLLKLTTWTHLPGDLWDRDLIIDATIADLRDMIATDDCASNA